MELIFIDVRHVRRQYRCDRERFLNSEGHYIEVWDSDDGETVQGARER
jgi:hypothetical protein